jgi:hypothetical protein
MGAGPVLKKFSVWALVFIVITATLIEHDRVLLGALHGTDALRGALSRVLVVTERSGGVMLGGVGLVRVALVEKVLEVEVPDDVHVDG